MFTTGNVALRNSHVLKTIVQSLAAQQGAGQKIEGINIGHVLEFNLKSYAIFLLFFFSLAQESSNVVMILGYFDWLKTACLMWHFMQ